MVREDDGGRVPGGGRVGLKTPGCIWSTAGISLDCPQPQARPPGLTWMTAQASRGPFQPHIQSQVKPRGPRSLSRTPVALRVKPNLPTEPVRALATRPPHPTLTSCQPPRLCLTPSPPFLPLGFFCLEGTPPPCNPSWDSQIRVSPNLTGVPRGSGCPPRLPSPSAPAPLLSCPVSPPGLCQPARPPPEAPVPLPFTGRTPSPHLGFRPHGCFFPEALRSRVSIDTITWPVSVFGPQLHAGGCGCPR